MKLRYLLILNLFFILFNCTDKRIQYEEKVLRNVVRKYIIALIETHRDFNLEHLDGIASEGEKRRIDVLILTMKMENKYLDASIKELKFRKIEKIDDLTYDVWTEEKWEYLHRDIKSKIPVDLPKTESYKMVYTLKKSGENWLVYYVDFADMRKEKKKDIYEEYQEFLKSRNKN